MSVPYSSGAPTTGIFADDTSGINMQMLASELASGLLPSREVWARHGLDEAGARRVAAIPAFQRLLAEARERWNSDDNAAERIRKKAQVALEQGLADIYADAVNPKIPFNHRIKGFEMLSRWAGVGVEASAGGVGPGVSIRIDLSGGPGGAGKVIDVTTSAAPPATDAAGAGGGWAGWNETDSADAD